MKTIERVDHVVVAPGMRALITPGPGGPGPQMIRGLVSELAAAYPPGAAGGPVTVSPVPRLDGRLGPAVLVACGGTPTLYCPAEAIGGPLAQLLPVFAAAAAAVLRPARAGVIGVRVARVEHERLPEDLHPALISARPAGNPVPVTVYVCANLLSSDLAAAMGRLFTAYASILRHPPACAEDAGQGT